jgi:hypothetical protein
MSRNDWHLLLGIGLPVLGVLGPLVFLAFGALALRRSNYDRAAAMSTIAGVWSWCLLGLEGLFMVPYLFRGGGLAWLNPVTAALLSYPPLLWFFARSVHRSAVRRREEDRLARKFLREEKRERKSDERRRAAESESRPE